MHYKVYQQFREWFLDNAFLWSVVSLPQKAFEPYGSGAKTSVLVFQRKPKGEIKQPKVFYARARFIGYKLQRQKYVPIQENELESPILPEFHRWLKDERYEDRYYAD